MRFVQFARISIKTTELESSSGDRNWGGMAFAAVARRTRWPHRFVRKSTTRLCSPWTPLKSVAVGSLMVHWLDAFTSKVMPESGVWGGTRNNSFREELRYNDDAASRWPLGQTKKNARTHASSSMSTTRRIPKERSGATLWKPTRG